MIERRLAHPRCTVRVDHLLLEEIAELIGIEYRVLSGRATSLPTNTTSSCGAWGGIKAALFL